MSQTAQETGPGVDHDALVTRYGFSIFPIPARSKRATCSWSEYQQRKPTAAELTDMKAHPDENAAIVCGAISGVVVLDIDNEAALEEVKRRGIPRTPCAKTARGWHLFFKHPGGTVGNFQGHHEGRIDGVDLKADGGYIVAPGSTHPSGAKYHWQITPDQAAFADMPDWLAEMAKEKPKPEPAPPNGAAGGAAESSEERYCRAALDNAIDRMRKAKDGDRNGTLNREAFALGQLAHYMSWSEGFIVDVLTRPALDAGLDRHEIGPTILSGARKGMAEPKTIPEPEAKVSEGYKRLLAKAKATTTIGTSGTIGTGIKAEAGDEAGTEFPEPSPSILNLDPLPAPPFPIEVFRIAAPYLERQAQSCGAPVDMVAAPFLSAASSCIGNACHVSPWSGWIEPPVLWTSVVGVPSSGKTPGQSAALRPLKAAQRTLRKPFAGRREEYEQALEIYKAEREQWKADVKEAVKKGMDKPPFPAGCSEPQEPVPPSLYSSDMTVEAAADLLLHNPKAIICYRDELSGWLGSFDRYNKGGDRAFWLEAFNGGMFSKHRKGEGETEIPHLSISVAGGIQPDRLFTLFMTGDDDGLLSRFIQFYPDPIPPKRPDQGGADDVLQGIYETLAGLGMGMDEDGNPCPRVIPLASDALPELDRWRDDNYRAAHEATGLMRSHYGKLDGMALRLALVFEFVEWAMNRERPQPHEVTAESFMLAAMFFSDYAAPMALRTYQSIGMELVDRQATALAWKILREKPSVINSRELSRSGGVRGISGDSRADQARRVCNALVEAGWLFPPEPAGKGGQTKADYVVNPRVYEIDLDRLAGQTGRP